MASIRLEAKKWAWAGVAGTCATALMACGGSSHNDEKSSDSGVTMGSDSGVTESGMVPPVGDSGHVGPPKKVLPGDASDEGVMIVHVDAGYPGPFAAMPQVVTTASPVSSGILVNPKIVAIFFMNDDPATITNYESFYNGLGATAYWAALGEYGIKAPTVDAITLAEDAPGTIDDTPTSDGSNTALNNWLQAEITKGTLPATDNNTEYVINYPTGTTVTSDGPSCQEWDGYHSDQTDTKNNLIAYAVVPRCPAGDGFSLDQTFTTTASHEVIEAATDPWPDYQPGWAQADNAHLFFDEANDGSEIGDMCQNDPEAYYNFSDFPSFMIQRFWSNASAEAGHDPCVPLLPGEVFFNAVPELPNTAPFPYYGNTVTVDAVNIAVGKSATILLDLYSDAPTSSWVVQMFDYNTFFVGSGSTALLTFDAASTNGITGNNGDKVPVTITVVAPGNMNTNQQVTNTELFVIQSTQGTGQNALQHFWYGLVNSQ
jgi:hypothetical protein